MRRRLLGTYLAIAVFVLLVLELPLAVIYANAEYDRLVNGVLNDAVFTSTLVEEALEDDEPVRLPAAVREVAAEGDARIVVTDADGLSVADTSDASVPRDYSTRTEVAAALAGEQVSGRRRSDTLDTELVYVAVPVAHEGEVIGAVRITAPTSVVRARVVRQWATLAGVALVVLAATSLVALAMSRWVGGPVVRIQQAVEDFAGGDLDARVDLAEGPPELVDLAGRIDDMAARIGGLVTVQRSFVADASHQLRTPLTGLRLELENLETTAGSPAQRAALERATDASRRLARMLDGLLLLARLEGQRPALEQVDVDALLDEVEATWSPLADEAGVRFTRQGTAGVVATVATHLAQVVDVLVDNAIAASPRGGAIVVAADRDVDGTVVVRVADEGPGMSAEDRERAFDRRWQGDVTTGSTGLGLAIARRLADVLRADLRLDTAATGGLAATVTLPGRSSPTS